MLIILAYNGLKKYMVRQNPRVKRAADIIGSPRFFWGVVALLVLQAAWIALSGRYPMAFDEGFHLGVIRIYSHHLSPFLGAQPSGADAFGAVARDPSYLYHYLMSFPYRLISALTSDQTIQVLILRAMNIGLFASGLVIWRRLLSKTRASGTMTNTALLIFVLIPVVPLLAAQINYDNLILPLAALTMLWAADAASKLGKKRVDLRSLLGLVILCLLTGLVKYAFLPIFIAIILYLVVTASRTFAGWTDFRGGLDSGIKAMGRGAAAAAVIGLCLSMLMFGQRYGVNLARYHTPVPACDQVLNADSCEAYGPWLRDQHYKASKTSSTTNPVVYAGDWLYGMWLRLLFAVDGPASNFQTKGPLVVPGMSAIIFTAGGVVLVLAYGRRVFRKYDRITLGLLISSAALYVGVLWLDEFMAYVSTGQPVAINGRYLFPVLPGLILLGGLAASEALKGRNGLKLALAGIAVLSLIWGGGALTYILRSDDAWYWPGGAMNGVNRTVRDTLGPVTPGYGRPGQFLR